MEGTELYKGKAKFAPPRHITCTVSTQEGQRSIRSIITLIFVQSRRGLHNFASKNGEIFSETFYELITL